jgi:hypothetical protein
MSAQWPVRTQMQTTTMEMVRLTSSARLNRPHIPSEIFPLPGPPTPCDNALDGDLVLVLPLKWFPSTLLFDAILLLCKVFLLAETYPNQKKLSLTQLKPG